MLYTKPRNGDLHVKTPTLLIKLMDRYEIIACYDQILLTKLTEFIELKIRNLRSQIISFKILLQIKFQERISVEKSCNRKDE